MGRMAFRDPVTGVLKCHGYVTANDPGDIAVDVPEEFNLTPGDWKWDGTAWQRNLDPRPLPVAKAQLKASLDAIAAPPQTPLRDLIDALKTFYNI